MDRVHKSLLLFGVTSMIVGGYTNCAKFATEKTSSLSSVSSNEQNGSSGSVVPPQGKKILSFGKAAAPAVKLGEKAATEILLSPNSGYSGDVTFAIDRSALSAIAGQEDIVLSVEPPVLKLNGQPQKIVFLVESAVTSPSFEPHFIRIKAQAKEPGFEDVTLDVPLAVLPEIDIKMFGGAIPADRWDRPVSMVFRKHQKPLTLNFINYDTSDTHVVHGLGSIPHQNVSMPLMKAPATGSPGGVYTVMIDASASQGHYYYHDIEDPSLARTMRFNLANPTSQSFQSLSLSEQMRSPSSSTEPHAPTHCSEM